MTATHPGRFVWYQYLSANPRQAQGFFGELFNWTVQELPMPEGTYQAIAIDGRMIGGYEPAYKGPTAWQSLLGVANAKESAAQVAALGGKVLSEVSMAFGNKAVVEDPHGGAFALWEPAQSEPEPPPITGAFCWNELMSVDAEASVKFYCAIGGLVDDAKDMGPMGTYHVLTSYRVLESGGAPRAGIMKRFSPQQPHMWTPYVSVASADATAEKAKRLGATIVVPPDDIPNVGRFSILMDPQGAAIGLLQPSST